MVHWIKLIGINTMYSCQLCWLFQGKMGCVALKTFTAAKDLVYIWIHNPYTSVGGGMIWAWWSMCVCACVKGGGCTHQRWSTSSTTSIMVRYTVVHIHRQCAKLERSRAKHLITALALYILFKHRLAILLLSNSVTIPLRNQVNASDRHSSHKCRSCTSPGYYLSCTFIHPHFPPCIQVILWGILWHTSEQDIMLSILWKFYAVCAPLRKEYIQRKMFSGKNDSIWNLEVLPRTSRVYCVLVDVLAAQQLQVTFGFMMLVLSGYPSFKGSVIQGLLVDVLEYLVHLNIKFMASAHMLIRKRTPNISISTFVFNHRGWSE